MPPVIAWPIWSDSLSALLRPWVEAWMTWAMLTGLVRPQRAGG